MKKEDEYETTESTEFFSVCSKRVDKKVEHGDVGNRLVGRGGGPGPELFTATRYEKGIRGTEGEETRAILSL
jgi:hypothetical protein